MDYVRMTGRFPKKISAVSDFPSWIQKVWPILTQPQTKLVANGNVGPGGDMEMDDETLTCFKSGVTSSFKPWLFTGTLISHTHNSYLVVMRELLFAPSLLPFRVFTNFIALSCLTPLLAVFSGPFLLP